MLNDSWSPGHMAFPAGSDLRGPSGGIRLELGAAESFFLPDLARLLVQRDALAGAGTVSSHKL